MFPTCSRSHPLSPIITIINTTSFSPRRSSCSSTHPSTTPIPNASPHNFKISGTAAEGFRCRLLGPILSTLSRRMAWSFTEHLSDKSGTRYNVSVSVTTYFGFIRHHQKRCAGMDDQKHEPYFDWEKFCLYMVVQQIDPWSMMSEVWEGEKIAEELSKGRVYHWEAEPTGQDYLYRNGFSLLSSLLACYSDSWCFPCFLFCIEFFQADCCWVFN